MPGLKYDRCLSPEQYLQVEETSREKHEYVAGRLFAMSGASDAHNVIAVNLLHYLYDQVADAGCYAYINDMKLRVETANSFYYPDVMATCEPFDADGKFKSAPCLVIEVLSPSTKVIDQREKLMAYRQLPSLVDYMIVYQDKRRVDLYRKNAEDDWELTVFTGDTTISLSALRGKPLALRMQDIYRRVEFRV
jgi:Uma2 family endonuclease